MYGDAMHAGRGHQRMGLMTADLPPAQLTHEFPALILATTSARV